MTVRTKAPLAAAVGLVAVAADQVRHLPHLVPVVVRQLGTARQRYDELAQHGQDVLAGRLPERHPVAPVPGLTDIEVLEVLEVDEVDGVVEVDVPVHEPATVVPAVRPPLGRSEPVTLPEAVLEEVAQLTPGADLAHDDLPLDDFDHLTVPQLRGRLRTLELPRLVQLRDYEQAHAHRLPVLTLLDNRIAGLTE